MNTYIKKVEEFTAFQLTIELIYSKFYGTINGTISVEETFPTGHVITYFRRKNTDPNVCPLFSTTYYAKLYYIDGEVICNLNDYIITDIYGNMFPCREAIFNKKYELINNN